MRHRKRKHKAPKLIGRTNLHINECGGCTACCTVMGVAELNKPAGERCYRCMECVGCIVHHTPGFPESCDNYECAWREGAFGREARLRPDRCKILINMEGSVWGPILMAREVEPGVLQDVIDRKSLLIDKSDRAAGLQAMMHLAVKSLVLVIGESSRRLIGPRALLEAAAKVAKIEIRRRERLKV